ncbi:MAG: AbrB/MazE/SpoVT family DNA-binding domain-containing protein [Candidatus Lokiarchaeota archaeon]|nr:AbrB/MazE/SpoVT family DNA-binding domain-containing protein [Candidatus Lokiarchaeota archaeon]
MNAESKIDDKGRVCIPNEIRKILNLKSGEKILFQVQEGKIILRKSTSVEEFIKKSDDFSKKLTEATKNTIQFKKLFE